VKVTSESQLPVKGMVRKKPTESRTIEGCPGGGAVEAAAVAAMGTNAAVATARAAQLRMSLA
jgi:hypothetical protein